MDLPALVKKVFQLSFIKFLFVAGINTLFGFLIYALTVFILKQLFSCSNVYLAVVIATIIAVLFNFKTYGTLVFKTKDNSRIIRFFGVYLCTMSLQMLSLKLLSLAGITNSYIAGGVILLPMSLLSFLLMRRFVFNNKLKARDAPIA
jgi:putative flippase GtrA